VTTASRFQDRFSRVDRIFDAALDLPPDQQTAFIVRECGDDEALRVEVLELVRAYHQADSLLDAPAARMAAPLLDAAAALAGPVPERIGAFRVVREIGRGGMGRVFLGERADGQFEQRVAIKLIQDGTPGVLRRFIEERRILALLEHPGIARLVDGGLTPGGLPYFAMELVEGEPIDAYCERRGLTLDQRLELFGRVCEAVAYAHHRLVIHRDLKPSNILVTPDGQPKLLDFGIAKLLGPAATDVTRTFLSAMTPEFAAPEQIRGAAVSTATDVYSLGVLLYVLLTGERPYDLRGKPPAEVERIVCDEPPPRPSSLAPAASRRALRGDLDLIVLTALQKDERRRYQSPGALAEDLMRYRRGEAIHARPDSARYRVGKFVARHRLAVGLTGLVVVTLAGAMGREMVLRGRAEVEARKAREVEQFLVGVFNVADPLARETRDDGNVTARELLERGVRRIDSSLGGQPEVQAELRGVLGRVYTSLGLYDEATPLLREALAQRTALRGASDSAVATTQDLLGTTLTQLNRYDEAEPLLREALEQRRRLLGDRHPATAESIEHLATLLEEQNKYDLAEPLYREVLAIRRSLGGDSTGEVATAIGNLGLLLHRKGAYAEAESLHRAALDIQRRVLGEGHQLTAITLQNLAMTLHTLGRFEESETYHRRALEVKRRVLGDDHPSVTVSMNNLANLLARQLGRLEEGEALARQALAGDRRTFGEEHSYVAASLANLGVILRLEGRFPEADSLLRLALAINRKVFGEHHERIAGNLSALASTRSEMGDGAGAVSYMRQSVAEYRQVLGDDHRNTAATVGSLALILAQHGDPMEAESLARVSLAKLDSARPEHRVYWIGAEHALAKSLVAQRRTDEALPLLVRLVETAEAQFGAGNWRTGDVLLTYGTALAALGRSAEARSVLRAAQAALDRNPAAR
jgi:tetratricopeptide (TPR) repeat protein